MSITWEVCIRGWRDHLAAGGRAQSTIKLRVSHLNALAHTVSHNPTEVTRETLAEYLARPEWSPATRRSHRSTIKTFYAWLHGSGHVDVDPAAGLPTVLQPRHLPRPASESATSLALSTREPRVRLMVGLMALCGLRRAEVATVRGADLLDSIHGPVLRVVGKGGHARQVPVPGWIAEQLRRSRGWLFPGAIDGHLSPRRVGELVRDVLPGDLTGHTLRHRYGTIAYGRSGDIRAVQDLMGHAKIETTAAYVAVDAAERRAAAEGAWRCVG